MTNNRKHRNQTAMSDYEIEKKRQDMRPRGNKDPDQKPLGRETKDYTCQSQREVEAFKDVLQGDVEQSSRKH